MNTAEYAVGTLAAVAFAGVLLKVVTSEPVRAALVQRVGVAGAATARCACGPFAVPDHVIAACAHAFAWPAFKSLLQPLYAADALLSGDAAVRESS